MALRPRRITVYVLRELLGPTLLGLTLYTFVLLMNHVFVVAEKSLTKNLGADLTLRLFLVGIPNILVLTIPMAVLLGCLIAVGRLSADHEWVALQAAGRGPGVLLKPMLIHGLIGTVVALAVYGVVLPRANFVLRGLRTEMIYASNLASDLKPRVFYSLPDDSVIFVDEIRAGGQRRLERLMLIRSKQRDGGGPTKMFLSRWGDLYPARDGSGRLFVDLEQGSYHEFDPDDPGSYGYAGEVANATEPIAAASFLAGLRSTPLDKRARDLTLGELLDEWREARAANRALGPPPPGRLGGSFLIADRRLAAATIELQQRVALPFASFVFALLALPLGIRRVRSGKGAGFALSLLVILVYRIAFVLARDQAAAGNFPPTLGPWMGNLVMLLWAAFAYWRLMRERARGGDRAPLAWLAERLRIGWVAMRRHLVLGQRAESSGVADAEAAEVELSSLGGTPNRFIARLDQYIGRSFLAVLVFAIGSAYLIYGLVELQDLTDAVLKTGQPYSLLGEYFIFFWPSVLHIVLPISCLVAAVVSVTLLARTNELTAMKAAGIGARRVMVPVLVLTTLLCGGLFLVQDRIAPAAGERAEAVRDRIRGKQPRTYGLHASGRWSFGPEGRRLYHYRYYDGAKGEFLGLNVFTVDRDGPRVLDHRFSARAHWDGASWELNDGWIFRFDAADGDVAYETFETRRDEELDAPSAFASEEVRLAAAGRELPEQTSVGVMRKQIARLEASGYDVTGLRVAYHSKYAQAFAPLVMVILGLPFGFQVGRRGSLYGIGVALLLVLVYWAALAVFNALGLETVLRPVVAAWAPNVLFGLFGAYLMLYVRT